MAAPEAPILYQGVPRTSAAFRLLKQMGWEEGEGLGKEKQGITEHVRVSKKNDNAGLGIDAQQKAASNWTFNTSVFDNILKNLKVIAADVEGGDPKKEELVVDDVNVEKSQLKKVTRPQGRYKRREISKIVRGYSQTDLDAILGHGCKTKKGALLVCCNKDRSVESLSEELCEVNSDSGAVSARLTEEKQVTCTTNVVVKSVELSQEVLVGNSANDWWGSKHGFVRGGVLGEIHRLKAQKMINGKGTISERSQIGVAEEVGLARRTSFCEQDQENLYKLVQDKATQGRQGLGIADRQKKIGGAHWKGQKVILDTSDDDVSQNQEAISVQDDILDLGDKCNGGEHKRKAPRVCDLEGETKEKSKKTKKEQGADKTKLKWKRLCEQLLWEVPDQTMSIKRLHKRIAGVCDLQPSNIAPDSEQAALFFKEKLQKSSKFVIKGKKVSLAAAQALD